MENIFDEALRYAGMCHAGMVRKGSGAPYMLHPMEVAEILSTMTNDSEILAAGLLHDTIEDTPATEEDIRSRFGDRVADLVMTETENKYPDLPPEETWQLRKEEALGVLRDATDPAVKMLWLADKLSNMRSFHRQYRDKGADMWLAYHQHDPKKHEWYYRKIAEYTSILQPYDAYQEYVAHLDQIFPHFEKRGETE